MSNYKEPEMETVELEKEDLDKVSGGVQLGSCRYDYWLPNDGKKCGGYFCVADSVINENGSLCGIVVR